MKSGYFHRVNEMSPTRMWINNPTPLDAAKGIYAGAVACTTNPTYSIKQIRNEETRIDALRIVDDVVNSEKDDDKAADLIQQRLVARIMPRFLPLHEANPGSQGFVSIQGNPLADDDADSIIDEAVRYRNLGVNFIAKIPVTAAGLKAIAALIARDIPVIATEVMSIAQAVSSCEVYKKASQESGKHPPFFLTHITGILDQHLQTVVREQKIDITEDALRQAGCIVARQQYRIFKERGYPGIMLGGGARGLHHFTEMVGSEMHITINWRGTADRLIELDPPVESRINTPLPPAVVAELLEKLPDFRLAYEEDALDVDEFKEFGPVELFRSMFVSGWEDLLETVRQRRAANI